MMDKQMAKALVSGVLGPLLACSALLLAGYCFGGKIGLGIAATIVFLGQGKSKRR